MRRTYLHSLLAVLAVAACTATYTADGDGPSGGDAGSSNGGTSSGSSGTSSGASGDPDGGSSGAPGPTSSSSGGSSGTAPPPCEPNLEQLAMLQVINTTRANAPGADPPLAAVGWDCKAAEALDAWTSVPSCDADSFDTAMPANSDLIFGTGDGFSNSAELLQSLADNGVYYDRATNSCNHSAPSICMPYTRIVRRYMSRVACSLGVVCGVNGNGAETRRFACAFIPGSNTPDATPY